MIKRQFAAGLLAAVASSAATVLKCEMGIRMKQKWKWDEIVGIILFLIAAGMLALSVSACFSSDIWYDELFTMGLARQSCGGLISLTARDVHPPLYYLIVKLFLLCAKNGDFFSQTAAAKLVSCLSFLLCLLFSMVKIRKHFGLLAAGLFCFLLLSMPQLTAYTVEIRMYGYTILWITAGMVYAYEIGKSDVEKRNSFLWGYNRNAMAESVPVMHGRDFRKCGFAKWAILTVCALFACYTHYFACVAACMIYLYLLLVISWRKRWRQMWKQYLTSSLICAAGYLPWLLLAVTKQVGQVQENYWIQPVSLRTLGGCVKFLFKPFFTNDSCNTALAAVFCGIYAVVMLLAFKEMKKEQHRRGKLFFGVGCMGVLIGLVFFGILASIIIRPIFVYRYMIPAMGVFWLAFAVLLSDLSESGARKKKVLFFVALGFAVTAGIQNFRVFYGEEKWKKMQMERAFTELSQIQSEDILLYNFDQLQGVVSYYLPNESYLWYGNTERLVQEMYPQNHSLVEGSFSDEEGILRLRQLTGEGKKVWFLGSFNAREEILEKWKQEGIEFEEKADIMIERYWFKIYLLM